MFFTPYLCLLWSNQSLCAEAHFLKKQNIHNSELHLSIAQISSATSGHWYSRLIQSNAVRVFHAALEVAWSCKIGQKYLFFSSFVIILDAIFMKSESLTGSNSYNYGGTGLVWTKTGLNRVLTVLVCASTVTLESFTWGKTNNQNLIQDFFWNNWCFKFSLLSMTKVQLANKLTLVDGKQDTEISYS